MGQVQVLLVDDDERKRAKILEQLTRLLPDGVVSTRASYRTGTAAAIELMPDLLVLDMTMPTFDRSPTEPGGRSRAFAGRDILRELARRKLLAKTIVISQYPEFIDGGERKTIGQLRLELSGEFPAYFLGAVAYKSGSTDWIDSLASILGQLTAGR